MKQAIAAQFGRPRGILGVLAGLTMRYNNRERTAWAVEMLHVQTHDRILEIGFGPGVAIQQIAALTTDGFVAGIDHSALMVQQARRRNAAAIRAGRVEVQHGSVERLPYADHTFDTVFTINSIMFWPEPQQHLHEVWRVLRPGGLVAIFQQPRLTREPAAVQQTADQIAAQLVEAGFDGIEVTVQPMQPLASVAVLGKREK